MGAVLPTTLRHSLVTIRSFQNQASTLLQPPTVSYVSHKTSVQCCCSLTFLSKIIALCAIISIFLSPILCTCSYLYTFVCTILRITHSHMNMSFVPISIFLGVFARFRKATISFLVSVRLSTWNSSAPTGWIFMKFYF